MKPPDARAILRKIPRAVSRWRTTGKRFHLSAHTLATYATAFEHPLMDEAERLAS